MFKTKKPGKHKFKLPTVISILLIIIAIVVVISWIPGTTGSYTDADGKVQPGGPAGIFDIFLAPLRGFGSKLDVILFVIILGGFVNIVISSGALDAGIGGLVKRLNGKEILIIPIIITLFSIGGTTYGMGEETIALYPVIIPVMLAAGFDVVTSILTILLGAGIGCAGSIINPFVIGVSIVGSTADLTTTSAGIIWRVVAWVVLTGATNGFVIWYALHVKHNPKKSPLYDRRDFYVKEFAMPDSLPEFTKKRKAIMYVFGLTFIIMVASMISYSSFGSPIKQWHDWMVKNIPYISSLFGTFGDFDLTEVAVIFLISTIVIGLINRESEDKFMSTFFQGSGGILSVGLVIATAAGIGYILLNTGMQTRLINALSQPLKSLGTTGFIVVAFIFFLPISFVIPSTSGFAAAVMPILGPVAETVHPGLFSGTITAFSLANGFINLCSPTSAILMAALAITKVPLDKYYKVAWPYFIAIFVIMLVLLVVGAQLPISKNGAFF